MGRLHGLAESDRDAGAAPAVVEQRYARIRHKSPRVLNCLQPPATSHRSLRLGEMLIERRQIQAEDLEKALELQRERGDKLGKILVDMGFIALRDVLAALSEQLGIPLATLEDP